MRTDIDQLDVEFNFKAKETFYLVYSQFNDAARRMSPMTDENVFQRTRTQYGLTLKNELERLAIMILQNNQEILGLNVLNGYLVNTINEYLQEFMVKTQRTLA